MDEGHDRIYVLGGHDSSYNRREVYYYTVSANSWTYHRCFSMNNDDKCIFISGNLVD